MPSHLKTFFLYQTIKKKTTTKKQTSTQFAGNKTSSDAYFWEDAWMETESLFN